MIRRIYPLLVLCFVLPIGSFAQQTEVRKYANEFLRIGVGARAFGMGNAMVAAADDVTAGYWNPAGLASPDAVNHPEISLMHSAYFANIATYNYLGFSMPINEEGTKRFGLTLIRLGVDDIPNTFNLINANGSIDYDKVETFSVTDFATLLTYAAQVGGVKGLSYGVNFKVIYRGIGKFANAWGFGVDIGLLYKLKRFRAGINVTDATYTYNAWTFNTETFQQAFINTGNEIPQNSVVLAPPTVRLGLAYDFKLARRVGFLLSLDGDLYFDGQRASIISGKTVSVDPRVGAELSIKNREYQPIVFLRGGVYNIQNVKNTIGEDAVGLFPTAGVGVVIKNFQIDYALANIGNLSENLYSHVVSLKFYIQ